MPGFSQPSALLVAAPHPRDRDFVAECGQALRRHFDRVVEPCAGAFAVPSGFLHVGWSTRQIECSDVNLFTTVCGYVAARKPLAELEVRVDGELLDVEGDPIEAAARLLYAQLDLRIACRPDNPYWEGIRRDLAYRREKHLGTIADGLRALAQRLDGFSYDAECMWQHIARVKDDPRTIISLSPPTYTGGYETFFDTDGRLTWAEPAYELFEPVAGFARLHAESRDWAALVLCLQEGGEVDGPVLYSRDVRPDVVNRVWSNQHDRVLVLTGMGAVVKPGELLRPDIPILPPDQPVTADSRVQITKLAPAEIAYVKNLWLHKIESSAGSWDFAVIIDGHLAGIAGVTAPQLQTWANQRGNLLLMFATACPHHDRLTRLVTKLALSRSVLRQIVDPWSMLQSERIVTAELTKLPEIKGLRGLMKLHDRKKDPKHGFRLIYRADIEDTTPAECVAWWRAKEDRWQAQRQTSAA